MALELKAWFGGTCEGDPVVDIWISRWHKGIWSLPIKAAEEEGLPHWNPVLFTAGDGTVYLFYKVGHTFSEWYTRIIISTDGGRRGRSEESTKGFIYRSDSIDGGKCWRWEHSLLAEAALRMTGGECVEGATFSEAK